MSIAQRVNLLVRLHRHQARAIAPIRPTIIATKAGSLSAVTRQIISRYATSKLVLFQVFYVLLLIVNIELLYLHSVPLGSPCVTAVSPDRIIALVLQTTPATRVDDPPVAANTVAPIALRPSLHATLAPCPARAIAHMRLTPAVTGVGGLNVVMHQTA